MTRRLRLIAGIALMSVATMAQASLVHDYELNNSLADRLGGPDLVSLGGSLEATDYRFGANRGLTLTDAFSDPATYSVEMRFSFARVDSWSKILSFRGHIPDEGLYVYSTELQFVIASGSSFADGQPGLFAENQVQRVILTRDNNTGQVVGYVNGIWQWAFADTARQAVFSSPGGMAEFYVDDSGTSGGEASAGVVDYIRIYDAPLTQAQAACLTTGTPQACGVGSAPEPATLVLAMLGLSGLGLARRRLSRA